MIKIKKGLDIPVSGKPSDEINPFLSNTVGIVCADYHSVRPLLNVQIGDQVGIGSCLFRDKNRQDICYTSPVSGVITAINRGQKRFLQSIEIECTEDKQSASFKAHDSFGSIPQQEIVDALVASGLWSSIRMRPFGTVAHFGDDVSSIFVKAIDTDPLGLNMNLVLKDQDELLRSGLEILTHLVPNKPIYIAKAPELVLPNGLPDLVKPVSFGGVHPAGLVGTHIHYLDPIYGEKRVWYIDVQDLLSIGRLFSEGKICFDRMVALGGPGVSNPCHLKTRMGVDLSGLNTYLKTAASNEAIRLIAGSVLSGRNAAGAYRFLGRYHYHVGALVDTHKRDFMGWAAPGFKRFSILNIYLSKLLKQEAKAPFNTLVNGSERAMVPIGTYEKVMPMDLLTTQLLRAIVIGDVQAAEQLGLLEIEEEDLALSTFVCHSKYEYGPLLRDMLNDCYKEIYLEE